MAQACAAPGFTYIGGVLSLAGAGTTRIVARSYRDAVLDGEFADTPFPGRTHLEIDLRWTNTTGIPQRFSATGERGPRLIITTNRVNAAFRERWTLAAGPDAKAPTPGMDITSSQQASNCQNPTGFGLPPNRPIVSYASFNRGRFLIGSGTVAPGDTVHARYRCNFFTEWLAGGPVSGGTPRFESRARWAELIIRAAPAAHDDGTNTAWEQSYG